MATLHTDLKVYQFLVGDFRCAWDALATQPESTTPNRGNFLFALQASVLLEWIGQLCASDTSGAAGRDFAQALQAIEPKYFTELDSPCQTTTNFAFPGVGPQPAKALLWALWDLVRNGTAHQYQDLMVNLTCGARLALHIVGVKYQVPLAQVAADRGNVGHLSFKTDGDGDVLIRVHPGALFLDIEKAVQNSGVLGRGLMVSPWVRPGNKPTYQFSKAQLETALRKGHHPTW